MDHLAQHIESLIFTADSPIAFAEIRTCLQTSFDTKIKKPLIEKAIDQLKEKYQQEEYSFELVAIAGGYQFLTKPAFHNTVGVYLKQTTKKRLSKAALETLSIIAYKQPVTKSEIEKIRGVSCDYSVQKLLEKELIAILGRAERPGKPLLYGTSEKFMDYFGLQDLEALPKPKDFREPDNEIGEKAPIDEDVQNSEDTLPIEATLPPPPDASQEIIQEEAAATNVEEKTPIEAEQAIPQSSEESSPISVETSETIPEDDRPAVPDAAVATPPPAFIIPTPPEETSIQEAEMPTVQEQEELPIPTEQFPDTFEEEEIEEEEEEEEGVITILAPPTTLEAVNISPAKKQKASPIPETTLEKMIEEVVAIIAHPIAFDLDNSSIEEDFIEGNTPSSTTPTTDLSSEDTVNGNTKSDD